MEEFSELGSECPDRGRTGRPILDEWRWPQPSGIYPSFRLFFPEASRGLRDSAIYLRQEIALTSHRAELSAF